MRQLALAFLAWSMFPTLAHAAAVHDAATVSTETPVPNTPTRRHGEYLHDGFYLRYALGPSAWLLLGTGSFVAGTPSGGAVGEILSVGGTIPNGIVIAASASAVISTETVIGNYGVLVDWFPDPSAGWHAGGLLGLGLVRFAAPVAVQYSGGMAIVTGGNLRSFALGATLFGGYDFWITPQCSLGLDVLASTATPTEMQDSNGNAFGYHFTPLWFGLFASVLYH